MSSNIISHLQNGHLMSSELENCCGGLGGLPELMRASKPSNKQGIRVTTSSRAQILQNGKGGEELELDRGGRAQRQCNAQSTPSAPRGNGKVCWEEDFEQKSEPQSRGMAIPARLAGAVDVVQSACTASTDAAMATTLQAKKLTRLNLCCLFAQRGLSNFYLQGMVKLGPAPHVPPTPYCSCKPPPTTSTTPVSPSGPASRSCSAPSS